MIEITVFDYLKAELSGIDVLMEIPSSPPDEFVLMQRTGGGLSNHIQTAMITIQSYSTTLYKTAALNEKVKEAMLKITESCDIARCSLNSDYNYPDTANKKYRYQAVFDLVY